MAKGKRYFREATRLARRGIGKSDPQYPAKFVKYVKSLRKDSAIPSLVEGVSKHQKLGQQDKAHALLLEAGKILSEHGPESLSSECQTDYCL